MCLVIINLFTGLMPVLLRDLFRGQGEAYCDPSAENTTYLTVGVQKMYFVDVAQSSLVTGLSHTAPY